MPGDFQIICGSVVGEIRRSPAWTETPGHWSMQIFFYLCDKALILKRSLTLI